MTEEQQNTEQKILDAAIEVFIQKGMDGARMQEIAEKARINKALLHYYYRSKDLLFMAVFKLVAKNIFPQFQEIFASEMNFFDKIRALIEKYIGLIGKNPFLPGFIMHELSRNPDKLAKIILDQGINPEFMMNVVKKAEDDGLIRPVDPRHLIVNILSMCIFPFAGKPLIQRIIFQQNPKDYELFLKTRAEVVSEFVINAIKK